ncbi:hypothetical protein Tco_1235974 [Tanacetum coccineum]
MVSLICSVESVSKSSYSCGFLGALVNYEPFQEVKDSKVSFDLRGSEAGADLPPFQYLLLGVSESLDYMFSLRRDNVTVNPFGDSEWLCGVVELHHWQWITEYGCALYENVVRGCMILLWLTESRNTTISMYSAMLKNRSAVFVSLTSSLQVYHQGTESFGYPASLLMVPFRYSKDSFNLLENQALLLNVLSVSTILTYELRIITFQDLRQLSSCLKRHFRRHLLRLGREGLNGFDSRYFMKHGCLNCFYETGADELRQGPVQNYCSSGSMVVDEGVTTWVIKQLLKQQFVPVDLGDIRVIKKVLKVPDN